MESHHRAVATFNAYLELIRAEGDRWEYGGVTYSISGWKEEPAGAIVGAVWDGPRRIGVYRIEADGTVARWPFSDDVLRARAKRLGAELSDRQRGDQSDLQRRDDLPLKAV